MKFYLRGLDGEAPEVYLQNTTRHPIHYEFARQVLGVAESRQEYERNTYAGDPRPAMAGTIAYYPHVDASSAALTGRLVAPFAVTFFPSDDLTPAQALRAHQLLEERLLCAALDGGEGRLVYLPAGSRQEEELAAASAVFDTREALWATQAEWYGDVSLQVLNDGLAYGTLRRMSPEELGSSVVSFQDVLVLTRLPNELPVVGGTITEELQTPLAHVNVSARDRGTPNIALLEASTDARVWPRCWASSCASRWRTAASH